MRVQVAHGAELHAEVVDLVPPWTVDPPTILMSHGVSTTADIFNGWLPHLIPHARIVRFDSRGFGRSTIPTGRHPWSIDLWADDMLAVADAFAVERFHIVAESAAGAAALRLASLDGGARVLSVTTCSAPYRGGDLARVAEWRSRLARDGIAAWSERMMGERFHDDQLAPAARDWFARQQAGGSAEVLADVAEMLVGVDLSADLAAIRVPVLVMAADGSPYVTVDIARAMQRLIPGAELRIIPHARHGIPFSHAEECARSCVAFLRRNGFVAG